LEQPLASAAGQLLASRGCVHAVTILLSVEITPPPVLLSLARRPRATDDTLLQGAWAEKRGHRLTTTIVKSQPIYKIFFTGSFLDKFLKSVNIWQSCKQERMVVSCTLRAWPTYSVLLKDEESARDNHVFAGNFAKYSPIKFFSLTDSAINLS